MSSNCLGLPMSPTSAHCCAILGQHTKISSINVPPSSCIRKPPFDLALEQRASSCHDWSAQRTAFESATPYLKSTYALQRRNNRYICTFVDRAYLNPRFCTLLALSAKCASPSYITTQVASVFKTTSACHPEAVPMSFRPYDDYKRTPFLLSWLTSPPCCLQEPSSKSKVLYIMTHRDENRGSRVKTN